MHATAVASVTAALARGDDRIAAKLALCEPASGVFRGHLIHHPGMNELGHSLERMSFMQLLLLFGFVTSYMVSVGGLFGAGVRLRAAAAALAQAVAFVALTEPWVHGALLVAFVVGALGVFVMLSWLLARMFGPRALPLPAPDSEAVDSSLPNSQPMPLRAPKLGQRVRATR
jgi:hypothetical protein